MAAQTPASVTCSLCLDMYQRPKNFPCGHTYCLACLERLVSTQKHTANLRCPECRQPVNLASRNLDKLPTNYAVLRMIEDLNTKQKPEEKSQTECGLCKESRSLTCFCRNCSIWMCQSCQKGHQVIPDLSHHQLATVEEITEEYREMSERTLEDIKPIYLKLRQKMDDLTKVYNDTSKSCKEIQFRIEADALKFHKIIDDLKTNLITRVVSFRNRKTSEVNVLREELQVQLASIESLQSGLQQTEGRVDLQSLKTHLYVANKLIFSFKDEVQPSSKKVFNSTLRLEPCDREMVATFEQNISLGSLHEGT